MIACVMRAARGEEEGSVDVGTVAGYKRVVMCQEVSVVMGEALHAPLHRVPGLAAPGPTWHCRACHVLSAQVEVAKTALKGAPTV